MENTGLIGDILALLGVFFLGFVAGVLFAPVQRLLAGVVRGPKVLVKGAQAVSTRLLEALSSAEDRIDNSRVSQSLTNAVTGVLTIGLRQAEAAFREGREAFDRGDYGTARRRLSLALLWDQRVELAPMHISAHLKLGMLDENKGDFAEAKKHYQRAAQLDPNNTEAAARLGIVHFRLKENGAALFQLQRALELDPSNLDTHYSLYTVYRQAGMEKEALEQLRIIKAGESADKLVELFAQHGAEHFRLEAYVEAAADYELALQLMPQSLPLYVALGDLYYLMKQPRTAVETWCRGLWEGYSEALAERVQTVANEADNVWEIITLVRDCTERHPQDGRYGLLLSRLLHLVGAEEERVARLEVAARVSAPPVAALMELGELYAQAGDAERASQCYRNGLMAARGQEEVFCCRVCGNVSSENQQRCFRCGNWQTFESRVRAGCEKKSTAPFDLLERASKVRHRLGSTWSRIKGLLPSAAPHSREEDKPV